MRTTPQAGWSPGSLSPALFYAAMHCHLRSSPQHERWPVTRIGHNSTSLFQGMDRQFRAAGDNLRGALITSPRNCHPEQRAQVAFLWQWSLCSACGPTCIAGPEG